MLCRTLLLGTKWKYLRGQWRRQQRHSAWVRQWHCWSGSTLYTWGWSPPPAEWCTTTQIPERATASLGEEQRSTRFRVCASEVSAARRDADASASSESWMEAHPAVLPSWLEAEAGIVLLYSVTSFIVGKTFHKCHVISEIHEVGYTLRL